MKYLLFILAIGAMGLPSRCALAVNSGDEVSFSAPSFTCYNIEQTFATATVNVSVPSRILINARVTLVGSNNTGTMAVAVADPLQQYNDIGFTGQVTSVSSPAYNESLMSLNEYALALGQSYTLVLAPGTYELVLEGFVNCSSASIPITGVLGWVLLSSAYDRIFADGFGTIG